MCVCVCLCDRAVGKVTIVCFIRAHLLMISVFALTICSHAASMNAPSQPARRRKCKHLNYLALNYFSTLSFAFDNRSTPVSATLLVVGASSTRHL